MTTKRKFNKFIGKVSPKHGSCTICAVLYKRDLRYKFNFDIKFACVRACGIYRI